jgi:hypothetical protein
MSARLLHSRTARSGPRRLSVNTRTRATDRHPPPVWAAGSGSSRTAPRTLPTRGSASERTLTSGFRSRPFSSLPGTLRPHVPSMCPEEGQRLGARVTSPASQRGLPPCRASIRTQVRVVETAAEVLEPSTVTTDEALAAGQLGGDPGVMGCVESVGRAVEAWHLSSRLFPAGSRMNTA